MRTARILCLLTLAHGAPTSVAAAQRDPTAFSLYIENDAFANSDTGYTNGIRFAWSIMRERPGMRIITGYNLATAVNGVLGAHLFGVPALSLERLRLDRLGLIPRRIDGGCDETMERAKRKVVTARHPITGAVMVTGGACMILNLGIAQTMYTPDSLATTRVQARDQPYAGFLYANFGVTTLDSPTATDPTHWLSYTEVSNQVIVGVTGQAAHAEDTQSLAHWTWSTGAHRPMGWNNQLRQGVQVGLLTDLAFRTRRFMEFCTHTCSGMETEGRWLDFTPHGEAVASTYMVRLSGGLTARLGAHFPDMVGTLRIPTSVPMGGARGRCVACERYWWYLFGNFDARYVPYNMFIEGGLADGGPTGWRTIRQITPRHRMKEVAGGLSIGNTRFSTRAQLAWRTPEYDVLGFPGAKGWHGYGSLLFAVHPRPE